MYGGKGQPDGDPGQLYGCASLRHPKDANEKKESADQLGCNQCKQPLIEIDNRGERLKGCLTCNLWSTVDRKLWKRLSEEDLRALHALVRHQ